MIFATVVHPYSCSGPCHAFSLSGWQLSYCCCSESDLLNSFPSLFRVLTTVCVLPPSWQLSYSWWNNSELSHNYSSMPWHAFSSSECHLSCSWCKNSDNFNSSSYPSWSWPWHAFLDSKRHLRYSLCNKTVLSTIIHVLGHGMHFHLQAGIFLHASSMKSMHALEKGLDSLS